MTKRNYLVFFLITALIFTMCSVSVFAEEGEAETLAAAPDSNVETVTTGDASVEDSNAEDVTTGETSASDSDASSDDAVSSDDTAADDTAASDDESEESDTATDDTAEGETKTEGETETDAEEEHDHAHEDGTKKKGLSTTAIVLLAVFGAIILIFAVLYLFKPKFRERVKKFLREYKSELKKVVWSSKSDVIKNTKIVVIGIVVIAVAVGLVDIGLGALIDLIGKIGK